MTRSLNLLAGLLLAVLASTTAFGATTVISDSYTGTSPGTGFALGDGLNYGINPPTTRLTGTAAPGLRYIKTGSKNDTAYSLSGGKFNVTKGDQSGRVTISSTSGTPAFDFAPALGLAGATPTTPAVYEVQIKMNNKGSTGKMSFAISTADGAAGSWNFGVQIEKNGTTYNVYKRIKTAATGLGSELNSVITTAGTATSESTFLLHITDAGMETDTYSSQLQLSVDGTLIYDTATDPDLDAHKWRFESSTRRFIWDQAINNGADQYDGFSVKIITPAPGAITDTWSGGGADGNWSSVDNWLGVVAPENNHLLAFTGTTRQANTNNLTGLNVLGLTFANGGFSLWGNAWTNSGAFTNVAGVNTLGGDVEWGSTGTKTWSVASGSELVLNNTNTVEVNGDHSIYGGGTLRQNKDILIGERGGAATPAFSVMEGVHIIDGGNFISHGSYRVGSMAPAPAGATTIMTNGATLYVKATSGSTRVGDSANSVPSRLLMYNSTYKTDGTPLYIPYVVGATGQVAQTGGLVSCPIILCNAGTNMGTYAITNGTLEAKYIQCTSANSDARMYFNNALVLTAPGAATAFMRGLAYAEIQSGGLTVEARDADVTIGQKLQGAGALTKTGSFTLTLGGSNTYSGTTYVNQGKLMLGTGGTYIAPIQLADYTELGVLVQSVDSSVTTAGLTLGGSGPTTLTFDLGSSANPTVPVLIATNLTVSALVSIDVLNGFLLTRGQFVLVKYEGSIGGLSFEDGFRLNSLPTGVSAELVNNTANHSIDLKITHAPGFLWTGAINSNWDYGTENWIDGRTDLPGVYSDTTVVRFEDGATTGLVTLAADPHPALIIVSNDTLPYVWDNAVAIHTPLVRKNGPGSVTRTGVEADDIATLELNAGSYIVTNANDADFKSVLTNSSPGTARFVKRGAGKLTMTAGNLNSNYTGMTIIQEGVVALGDTRALGSTIATIIITNGGTLELNDHQPKQPAIVSGDGKDGIGAIIDSTTATGVEENFMDVTLAGDTTFGCPNGGRWDIRVNSGTGPAAGLKGNGHTLTKVGTGSVSIACQRSTTGYWQMNLGDVLIKEGGLTFAESLTPGNPSAALAIYPGANLNLYDLNITNPLMRSITMTNALVQCGGTTKDTNVVNGNILMSGDCRFKADDAHLIINGAISGDAAVGFYVTGSSGTGTLLLNGINTYTGDTTVTNGTFGGIGELASNLVMLGGTNAPGNDAVGTLTVHGNVTLAGTTRMELDRSRSPNSDLLIVGGMLSYGGVLQVKLGAGAPAPQGGDVYQLFSKGSSTVFTTVDLPTLTAPLTWNSDNLAVDGTISVTGGAPPPTRIGSYGLDGNTLTFGGTGGTQGSTYYVVSSPNVEAALKDWVPVATNVFGSDGSFVFTTNIVTFGPRTFFRVAAPY